LSTWGEWTTTRSFWAMLMIHTAADSVATIIAILAAILKELTLNYEIGEASGGT